MKKKLFAVAVIAICLAILASGSLAYFTAEDTAHNVITSGGVNIDVVEKTKGEGDVLVDFPEEGIKNVMPGAAVSKIVQVENTGASEAWIRVKVEATIVSEAGEDLPLTIGEDEIPVMAYSVLEGWVDGGDGYWYYETPVAPETMTEVLFEEVVFEPSMGNEYQNCTANLIISAEAVQTANNGETVLDAQGWPEASEEAADEEIAE